MKPPSPAEVNEYAIDLSALQAEGQRLEQQFKALVMRVRGLESAIAKIEEYSNIKGHIAVEQKNARLEQRLDHALKALRGEPCDE